MQQDFKNVVVYLLGFPGTGKYTICQELAKLAGFRIVDNHLINNPVFSLICMNDETTLSPRVWDYTDRIWEVVADTMVHLSAEDENFALTNFLLDGDSGDARHFETVATVARQRNALFVPVRLHISSKEEHIRRMTTKDRSARLKLTDAARIEEYATKSILDPAHPHCLTLDVTHLSPVAAAQAILGHVAALAR